MTESSAAAAAAADFHLDLGVFKKALTDRSLQTKNHQLDGVKWCVRNETKGNVIESKTVHGGIVADEMGLGKTIQMVGVIITHFLLHTLIIVPKAILEQWESEIFKLTSHRAFVYHGNNRKNYAKLKTSPIVITTYGMISKPSSEIFKIKWDRAIFDEAHHLKNKNTKIYAGAISLQADIKWAVTGTPIQNNKTDFYNICAVLGLDRGMFSKDKDEEGLGGFEKCRQIVLKRTKREVGIQMADVTCETINITWGNKSEKKLAENIHSMTQFSLPRRYQTRQQYKEQQQQEEKQNKQKPAASWCLPLLLKAKQMCVFPALINKPFRITPNQELSIINGTSHTTKIDSLIQKIIDRKENKRPKLIFCHFRGEIDIIKKRLESDFDVQVIDGRTTDKQKKEILKNASSSSSTQAQAQATRIQTRQQIHKEKEKKEREGEKKSKILILQIQTGCEGLNLQEYNEVYFVSPHWNPAVESQAIARCHRIGQTHRVDVFRFIMTWNDPGFKSMDEYCEQVQVAKQKIYSDFFSQQSN